MLLLSYLPHAGPSASKIKAYNSGCHDIVDLLNEKSNNFPVLIRRCNIFLAKIAIPAQRLH
ncbi:hypothetical protein [Ruminiclostridium herbifermentans]|nr:hypothetical protein [Ruminiclostridium herbifermentans]